jgi:hypothetical protein
MSEANQDGWAEHEKEQRRAWMRLSYQQRLDWLEQMKEFCREALGAARRASQKKTKPEEEAPPTPEKE